MSPLRQRLIEDLQLAGLAQRTVVSYSSAVVKLSKHFGRSPDQLSEEELRQFFVHLIQERHLSDSSFKVYATAIKFFYERTLGREWKIFNLVRPEKSRKLPFCLSHKEVKSLLSQIRLYDCRIALTTIYGCGLRLSECLNIRIQNLDGNRKMLQVVAGKGKKDRYIPIPDRLLSLLRNYWICQRPSDYLFPSPRDPEKIMPKSRLQKVFKKVVKESQTSHQQTSIHTLRHSYATGLMDKGISLKMIQELLGHNSISTTQVYTHLTHPQVFDLRQTVNDLMSDL